MWRTLRAAGQGWAEDKASYLGAAVAYYALFSVAPLLVLALELATLALGPAAARNQLADQLQQFVGPEAAQAVQSLVLHARKPGLSGWMSLIASGVLLFTAANLFLQLRTGLSLIWRLPLRKSDGFWNGTLKDYMLALAMVVSVGLFCLLLMVGSTLLGMFIELWGDWLPGGAMLWRVSDLALLFLLMTTLLTFMFRMLSDGRIPYRHVWKGAALSTLLFILGKTAFAWYVALVGANLASTYGAASSLIIFLTWVYYSAQILYMGAELIKADWAQAAGGAAPST